MSASPVLALFGAGPRIGTSVADFFASNGYQVALLSRTTPKTPLKDRQTHFVCDCYDPSSVVKALAEISNKVGVPSVVVYNAYGHTPTDRNDPLSLPYEDLGRDLIPNVVSPYAAAQEAIKGWRTLPRDVPKAFIFTGNRTNIEPIAFLVSNGTGKQATAHWIDIASKTYKEEEFKFYYADERVASGQPVYNDVSGEAHAKFYYELANGKEQGRWLASFVKDKGYVDFDGRK